MCLDPTWDFSPWLQRRRLPGLLPWSLKHSGKLRNEHCSCSAAARPSCLQLPLAAVTKGGRKQFCSRSWQPLATTLVLISDKEMSAAPSVLSSALTRAASGTQLSPSVIKTGLKDMQEKNERCVCSAGCQKGLQAFCSLFDANPAAGLLPTVSDKS